MAASGRQSRVVPEPKRDRWRGATDEVFSISSPLNCNLYQSLNTIARKRNFKFKPITEPEMGSFLTSLREAFWLHLEVCEANSQQQIVNNLRRFSRKRWNASPASPLNCNLTLFGVNDILNAVIDALIIVGQYAIDAHFEELAGFDGVVRPEHIALYSVLVALVDKLL